MASHAEWTDGPLPTPNRQGLHCGTPPELASALICNLPGSLQHRLQSRSDRLPHPPDIPTSLRLKRVGKPAWEACMAAAWAVFILKKHALCSYESGNFTHIDFALCFFLPTERGPGWISMLFGINAYPNPLVLLLTRWHFIKENAPLLYSYNVQAQSKHWMLPPLNVFKFEY